MDYHGGERANAGDVGNPKVTCKRANCNALQMFLFQELPQTGLFIPQPELPLLPLLCEGPVLQGQE